MDAGLKVDYTTIIAHIIGMVNSLLMNKIVEING